MSPDENVGELLFDRRIEPVCLWVSPAGLDLTDSPTSALRGLGLKAWATTARPEKKFP